MTACRGARCSIALLIVAEMAAMSLWFVSAAILPELIAEAELSSQRAAALSSAVQLGFFLGAVVLSLHGTADRFDPRRIEQDEAPLVLDSGDPKLGRDELIGPSPRLALQLSAGGAIGK